MVFQINWPDCRFHAWYLQHHPLHYSSELHDTYGNYNQNIWYHIKFIITFTSFLTVLIYFHLFYEKTQNKKEIT